ncbi:hypothetical protein [Pengzhenrongella sp.]|jgi:hypothetical protein|uniref:hypothetical protein n=1 Tax=Pengzhenrongella sp. TaxID=2888820 RepID=UPI002F93BA54
MDDDVTMVAAQMLAATVWANNHGGEAGDSTADVRRLRIHDQNVSAAKFARTQDNAGDADKDMTAADLLTMLELS